MNNKYNDENVEDNHGKPIYNSLRQSNTSLKKDVLGLKRRQVCSKLKISLGKSTDTRVMIYQIKALKVRRGDCLS